MEDGFYFEMTCKANLYSAEFADLGIQCGQRFKIVKGTGGIPLCPKCHALQDIRKTVNPGLLEAISGIPVD